MKKTEMTARQIKAQREDEIACAVVMTITLGIFIWQAISHLI